MLRIWALKIFYVMGIYSMYALRRSLKVPHIVATQCGEVRLCQPCPLRRFNPWLHGWLPPGTATRGHPATPMSRYSQPYEVIDKIMSLAVSTQIPGYHSNEVVQCDRLYVRSLRLRFRK